MMDDYISRQAAIDMLKNRWKKTRNYEGIGDDIAEECELYLKQVPSAQPEQAVKDCRNCKHGKYNDYHDTYFCYNAEDCSNWDKWETSAQLNYGDCTGCKHLPRFSRETPCVNCSNNYVNRWERNDRTDP